MGGEAQPSTAKRALLLGVGPSDIYAQTRSTFELSPASSLFYIQSEMLPMSLV